MPLKVGVEFHPDAAMKRIYRTYFALVLLSAFLSWITPIVVYVLWFESGYAAVLGLLLTPRPISSLFIFYWIPKYYRSVSYLLTDKEVVVTEGVWFRSKRFVPYNRITNVETHQGPISRRFNVGTVSIQTAGYTQPTNSIVGRSAESEVRFIENFDEVKDTIRSFIGQTRPAAVEAAKDSSFTESVENQILEELKKIRRALEK